MRHTFLTTLLLLITIPLCSNAQNWDYVQNHPEEYYFGEGHGKTAEDAMASLMNAISGQIATRVTSETEINTKGGNTEFKNYITTYSGVFLNNIVSLPLAGKAPNLIQRGWVKRADVERMFAERANSAKDYIKIADDHLAEYEIKEALENYYYAYLLLCSLQSPSSVEDNNGIALTTSLPNKVKDILSDVKAVFKNAENVDDEIEITLGFTYKGKPVKSLEYLYNDGNVDNLPGCAKDGIGVLRLKQGYTGKAYHLNIRHTFKHEASYDAMLKSIARLTPDFVYKENYKLVENTGSAAKAPAGGSKQPAGKKGNAGIALTPTASQVVADPKPYMDLLDNVFKAIKSRQYSTLPTSKYFTSNGRDVFDRLIKYGRANIIGTPDIHFFKGPRGSVVARGLQMSFSFSKNGSKTFVEDVVFAFNEEGKIDNIAFGLGKDATNDLLCKDTPKFTYKERELIAEFLESYKTAYCLERKEFIETIFSDSSVIITGHVVKNRKPAVGKENQPYISNDEIVYTQHNKEQYVRRLEQIFRNNEFINIHFADNKVQPLIKFEDRRLYGITIRQHYTSSSYSDKGYLFLYVDMSNPDEPTIIARTWQPDFIDPAAVFGLDDLE